MQTTFPSIIDAIKEIPQIPTDIDLADKELIVQARMTEVADDASLLLASDIYTRLAARKKEFTRQLSTFDDKKKALKAALDSMFNMFKKILVEPFDKAMGPLGGKIATYNDKKEQERQAEERCIQEMALKQAEEAQLAAAMEAEKSGHHKEAAALIEDAPIIPTVIIPKATPKVAGIATQVYYSAEVVDVKALFKAVHKGKVPLQVFEINQSFLNRQASMLKEAMKYPGVTVKAESRTRPTGRS